MDLQPRRRSRRPAVFRAGPPDGGNGQSSHARCTPPTDTRNTPMKLFVSPRAPSPRRVLMFLVEKNISGIDLVDVDLNAQEHKQAELSEQKPAGPCARAGAGRRPRADRNPRHLHLPGGPVPRAQPDGRRRQRARLHRNGRPAHRVVFPGCPLPTASATPTPGLAPLEQPQFPDYGQSQGAKLRETARWLDGELQRQPWVAGDRFTIADITAFCALEFARLMRFKPGRRGLCRAAGLARPGGAAAERQGLTRDRARDRWASVLHAGHTGWL